MKNGASKGKTRRRQTIWPCAAVFAMRRLRKARFSLRQHRTIRRHAGGCFLAIHFLQAPRFTIGKPSGYAIVPDEKSARRHTASFVRYCVKKTYDLRNRVRRKTVRRCAALFVRLS
jgi:hypothetical protein